MLNVMKVMKIKMKMLWAFFKWIYIFLVILCSKILYCVEIDNCKYKNAWNNNKNSYKWLEMLCELIDVNV